MGPVRQQDAVVSRGGLGTAIQRARKASGWTKEELAQHSGVARVTLARLETGQGCSSSTLLKLAAAMNLQLLQQHR